MSHPYEVLSIGPDGKEDSWPCSSLDAAFLRMNDMKATAVFVQVREFGREIKREWRRSQEPTKGDAPVGRLAKGMPYGMDSHDPTDTRI